MNRREFFAKTSAAALIAAIPIRRLVGSPRLIAQIELYEVRGQTVFPWYHQFGGLSTRQCCFPMVRESHTELLVMGHYRDLLEWHGKRQTAEDFSANGVARMKAALLFGHQSFQKGSEGDEMPRDGEIVRFVLKERS